MGGQPLRRAHAETGHVRYVTPASCAASLEQERAAHSGRPLRQSVWMMEDWTISFLCAMHAMATSMRIASCRATADTDRACSDLSKPHRCVVARDRGAVFRRHIYSAPTLRLSSFAYCYASSQFVSNRASRHVHVVSYRAARCSPLLDVEREDEDDEEDDDEGRQFRGPTAGRAIDRS